MRRRLAPFAAVIALAGCGDPLERVAKLSEVELAEAPAAVTLAEPADAPEARARMGGLLAQMLRPGPAADAETPSPAVAGTDGNAAAAGADAGAAPSAAQTAPETLPGDASDPPPRGLRALFARQQPADPNQQDAPAVAAATPPAGDSVAVAAASPAPDLVEPAKRQGLFGNPRADRAAPRAPAIDRNAPDARLVPAGTPLPYGEVARVCSLPRAAMGREVAQYPERGPVYRLYDSAPGSTGARAFFVTGFPDGCARQFTGALAMFGAPSMHEQLRYGAPARSIPYSATDQAYERIKAQICGVARNTPCGARVSTLEKDTAFVTVYESFGGSTRWVNLLLHDRQLVASAVNGK